MKYKVNKGFINQRIGEKIVIFDSEEPSTYTLNPIGSFIFEKLKDGWNQKKIIKAVVEKYDSTEENVAKDMEDFIQKLVKMKLLAK